MRCFKVQESDVGIGSADKVFLLLDLHFHCCKIRPALRLRGVANVI